MVKKANGIPQESASVQRARKKLEQQIQEERGQINPESLKKVTKSIREWIDRHAQERVKLEDKGFSLFDENAHTAKTSSIYVRELRRQLKNSIQEEGSSLAGRVTHQRQED